MVDVKCLIKKSFLLVILFSLICTLLFACEVQADTTPSFGYTVNQDDTISINGCSVSTGEIIIPAIIDGHNVVSISPYAFSDCEGISSIILPSSLTSIGEYAFSGCSSLTSIEIPDSVTSIGDSAFYGCNSLDKIIIPKSVSNIGTSAFADNDKLDVYINNSQTNINISNTSFDGVNSVNYLKSISAKNVPVFIEIWSDEEWTGFSGIQIELTYENSVAEVSDLVDISKTYITGFDETKVGQQTIAITYGHQSVNTTINVLLGGPCGTGTKWQVNGETETLTIFGEGAIFDYIYGQAPWYQYAGVIKHIVVEDAITGISNGAFYGLNSVESITVPFVGLNSNASGNEGVFGVIFGYTSVSGGTNITVYSGSTNQALSKMSYESGGASYDQPYTQEGYGQQNYIKYSDSLIKGQSTYFTNKYVKLTNSNAVWQYSCYPTYFCNNYPGDQFYLIKSYYYYIPSSLTKVVVTGATKISQAAFNNCKSIKEVTLNEGLSSIEAYAFYNSGIENIKVPTTTSSLMEKVFANCSNLDTLMLPSSIAYMRENIVEGSSNATVVIVRNSFVDGSIAKLNGAKSIKYSDEIKSFSIETAPTKLVFVVNTEFNTNGGKLKVVRYDESVEIIDMSEATISGYDMSTTGKQTVTVSFETETVEYEISVVEKILVSIAVTTNPTKTFYLKGKDSFNPTGGKITKYYENDVKEVVDLKTAVITGFDNTTVGTQTLTVKLDEKETTFDITIISDSVLSIAFKTNPTKVSYLEGKDSFDLTGAVLTLTYNNDITEDVTLVVEGSLISGVTFTGFDNTVVGSQEVTVSYLGKSATVDVTIAAKSLTSIDVTTGLTKTSYLEAKDILDLTGGKLTLYYDNDTTDEIDLTADGVSVTGFDNTVTGTCTLTVTYGGKETSYDVTITAKSLTSIDVTTDITKTSYLEAKDELDLSGGKLTLYFDNDTTDEIDLTADGVSVTGFDNTVTGTCTLTVTYGGKETSYDVTITAKSISSIAVTTLPTKTKYIEGYETLNLAGGKLTIYYNNGQSITCDLTTNGVVVSGFNNTKVGTNTISVACGGKKTTFNVTIKAKNLAKIEMAKQPNILEYRTGESIDPTGGVILLTYDNKTTARMDITKSMISSFDSSTAGTKTVIVKYLDKVTNFVVKVIDYIKGDFNDDKQVTDADAVYLLYNTFFPDEYPLNQDADFNNDGQVTDADAVYLLYNTFFPDEYPLQ